MKDIRCILRLHKQVQIHSTELTSARCGTVFFTWYLCTRCEMKGIQSSDSVGRSGQMEWKKEWSVAPYSNNSDNIMEYQKREFKMMFEDKTK